MTVKIDGKKLNLKNFEVETSTRNVRACMVAQRDFAKASIALKNLDTDDDESLLKFLDAQISLLDSQKEFLKSMLNLSATQLEKVDKAKPAVVTDFVTDVINAILEVDPNKSEDAEG